MYNKRAFILNNSFMTGFSNLLEGLALQYNPYIEKFENNKGFCEYLERGQFSWFDDENIFSCMYMNFASDPDDVDESEETGVVVDMDVSNFPVIKLIMTGLFEGDNKEEKEITIADNATSDEIVAQVDAIVAEAQPRVCHNANINEDYTEATADLTDEESKNLETAINSINESIDSLDEGIFDGIKKGLAALSNKLLTALTVKLAGTNTAASTKILNAIGDGVEEVVDNQIHTKGYFGKFADKLAAAQGVIKVCKADKQALNDAVESVAKLIISNYKSEHPEAKVGLNLEVSKDAVSLDAYTWDAIKENPANPELIDAISQLVNTYCKLANHTTSVTFGRYNSLEEAAKFVISKAIEENNPGALITYARLVAEEAEPVKETFTA